MPYIKKDRRAAYDPIVEALQQRLRINGCERGDVNYVVTRIALGVLATVPGYKNYSDAIAALQDAADEIKQRCLGPYETFAAYKNGDVPEMITGQFEVEAQWIGVINSRKPLSGPVEKEFVVKPDGSTFVVVDSPISQVAAEQYQDLQDEVKEAFDRR